MELYHAMFGYAQWRIEWAVGPFHVRSTQSTEPLRPAWARVGGWRPSLVGACGQNAIFLAGGHSLERRAAFDPGRMGVVYSGASSATVHRRAVGSHTVASGAGRGSGEAGGVYRFRAHSDQ